MNEIESLLVRKPRDKKIEDQQIRSFLIEAFFNVDISISEAIYALAIAERFLCYTLIRGDINIIMLISVSIYITQKLLWDQK